MICPPLHELQQQLVVVGTSQGRQHGGENIIDEGFVVPRVQLRLINSIFVLRAQVVDCYIQGHAVFRTELAYLLPLENPLPQNPKPRPALQCPS